MFKCVGRWGSEIQVLGVGGDLQSRVPGFTEGFGFEVRVFLG